MSKKSQKRIVTPGANLHHLCWPRRKWKRGFAKLLRNHWYMKIRIPANTLHKEIHGRMGEIPVPSPIASKEAYEQLDLLDKMGALHTNDGIEKRLNLIAALFDCIDQPTADAFREQIYIVRDYNKKAPP